MSEHILPAITLYQPWATWVMRGWKTIETRTHKKFACLKTKSILIHAGMLTDKNAIENPYLTESQLLYRPEEVINGFILGSATVVDFGVLNDTHSQDALIECSPTTRYGLFLKDVVLFDDPIPCKGSMGIWYYDLVRNEKVKKPQKQNHRLLF